MARPKKIQAEEGQETEAPKNNIENLEALKEEFLRGNLVKGKRVQMPERKLIALREKLVSLFKTQKSTPAEQELMEAILRRDRDRGSILTSNEYLLNGIENERCETFCIVKTDDTPPVHHLSKHLRCGFIYDPEFNDKKNKPDSIGRYYVYVPVTVPTLHQLKNSTVLKENRGHTPDPSEYPEPYVKIHRIGFKEREFNAYFEEEEDVLGADDEGEEEEFKF
jgi:hypothetical protein